MLPRNRTPLRYAILLAPVLALAGRHALADGAPPAAPPATAPPPATPAAAAPASWFEDVTERAGVAAPHHNRVFENPYAEIMQGYTALGAAAAVADFDGDGFEDLFVTDSSRDGRNHLYRNNGDFTFTDVAEQAGVAAGNDAENASADALWFDYNNDGRPDLFVVRFGHSQLFENLGNGRFKDVTAKAGLGRYANAITAIAFDYDRDGHTDLLIGSYFQPVNVFHPDTPRFFPESFETANNGGGVTLYRNLGDGTFRDVTREAGLTLSGWTLDVGHGDADNDGDDDLYVACDFGSDRFFVNNGDGTFTDRTKTAIGIDTKKGMNAEWGDFDGDGLLDVFVTNITDDYMREGNFLWKNNGPGADGNVTFTDVARETGTHDTGWGWGGKFFDYDNDGWLDLYVVNGWVSAGKESYVPDIFAMITKPGGVDFTDARNWPAMGGKSLSGYEKKKLFHNLGDGSFKEESHRHGLDSTRDGRGIAVADFDNDGRMDVFVANANAAPFLYRNVAPREAHWLELVLEGRKSNRDAIGTQVRLTVGGRTLLRFVDGGNGFAGQSTKRLHFGLGAAVTAGRLEVRWPSGLRQTFDNVPADRILHLTEGETELRPLATAGGISRAPGETPRMNRSALRLLGAFGVVLVLEACASAPRPRTAAAPVAPAAVSAAGPLLEAGWAAIAAHDDKAALDKLEAALEIEPENMRAASEYRLAVIRLAAYDRALAFFEKLAAAHPGSANVELNWGFAYVDKIPAQGAITRVILADSALHHFTRSVELEPTWIALYTRGNSYLYWPKVFGRVPLAIADLERALAMAKTLPRRRAYARGWAALGDAYWQSDQKDKARATWKEGLESFPGDAHLLARLGKDDEQVAAYLYDQLDPNLRVDTNLADLWSNP